MVLCVCMFVFVRACMRARVSARVRACVCVRVSGRARGRMRGRAFMRSCVCVVGQNKQQHLTRPCYGGMVA